MAMQRLFSGFPNSWPGTGLLLLRVSVAVVIGLDSLWAWEWGGATVALAGWLSAAMLLAGLWTPPAALLAVMVEAIIWYLRARSPLLHTLCIGSALSLALIGPGAWSVDAYIYGRKRLL